ncbi:hypothetical protein V8F33_011708 [Rhypophila sp. PSN 637]
MAPPADALEAMNSVVSSAISLLSQFEAVIEPFHDRKSTNPAPAPTQELPEQQQQTSSVDPFSLAHDSTNLIRAHATKISLFIINEPFTPTAITKVLRELVAGPLPALTAAVQLCDSQTYTKVIQRDIAWHCSRVFKELRELLQKVPKDGKILVGDKKNASAGAASGKGSIAATGVLWSVCDDLMALAKRGFAGNVVLKVEQFRDTLKDTIEELKEWGDETGDGEDDGEDDDGEDEVKQITEGVASTHMDAQDMLDDLMGSQDYIPRDDPDKIRERLESCLKRLRLVTLLYSAIIKRRLKPLPRLPLSTAVPDGLPTVAARLDEIIPLLAKIPERFGDLAIAFYGLDPGEIDKLMDQCFFDAYAASELLMKAWDGEKDAFTEWALKFQVEIKKS